MILTVKKNLTIHLTNLPEEGNTFSGELDGTIFSNLGEKIKPTSPLFYDLFIQKFDSELLVRGNLSASFEFICDRCLVSFTQTIAVNDFSLCKEVPGSQIDLTDTLIEEIVILFPDYPHCEQADEPGECNLDSRYLAVDKPPVGDVKTLPHDEAPTPWDALDALDDDQKTDPS